MYVRSYVWERQQGKESRILDFSSQNCRRILWNTLYVRPYFVLAQDWDSKATNSISSFTPPKISFPSPDNFLSDRAEHRARKINCATKNKNPIQGFPPAQPQLKVILTLLFWKEYSFYYYSLVNSTICTTNLLKTVLLLFSLLVFSLFWKEFFFQFIRRLLFWKEYLSCTNISTNWIFCLYWWLNSLS